MLRSALLNLSHSPRARQFVTRFPLARLAAARFIAGDGPDDAIRVIRHLNQIGIQATVDHLGENVHTAEDARRAAADYLTILDHIHEAGVQSHTSVKLTHLGLDLGADVCRDNLARLAERAGKWDNFVRVDMEGTPYTDRTLAVVRAVRFDLGLANVGVVLQSYLYRTEADLRQVIADGIRVRLCKGAYDEPPDNAYPHKKDVDSAYVRLARILLDAVAAEGSRPGGLFPAFATHDARMIAAAQEYAAEKGIPPSAYEFQMLHGIRRDLQASLARQGYGMRVYVPYGSQWYPYFMRRLAERPANLWFFAANLLRR